MQSVDEIEKIIKDGVDAEISPSADEVIIKTKEESKGDELDMLKIQYDKLKSDNDELRGKYKKLIQIITDIIQNPKWDYKD